MQIKVDAALLVVAQCHVENATDIFACKRRVVDKFLVKIYALATHIEHQVLSAFREQFAQHAI